MSEPATPATSQEVRRATITIVAAIAVATLVIILTIMNSEPSRKCRFLLDRVASGNATEAEFEEWDQLGCGQMDI